MDFLDDSADGEVLDAPVKPGTIRVILADSQAIYRVGIRKVFALEDDLRVVAQADSLENLRAAIARYPTDIVLLEGSLLAGTANVIPALLRVAPEVKLIVQAVAADENQTVELYRRGVRGIVSRSISPDLLVRCVRRIAAGTLPGRGDGGGQTVPCVPAAARVLRIEGLSADARDRNHDSRPELPGRAGALPNRARAGRIGAELAQRLPERGGTDAGADAEPGGAEG